MGGKLRDGGVAIGTMVMEFNSTGIGRLAVEAGAEDVEQGDGEYLVTTAREDLYAVSEALEEAGITPNESKLAKVPQTVVEITVVGTAKKVLNLIEQLEDNDDVQAVWANFDISDDVASALASE